MLAPYAHHHAASALQHLHDGGLVRPSAVQRAPLWQAILVSWGIAFFEYCLMVPANRIGHGRFTGAHLKTIQEVITLVVFSGFSVLYLRESLRWNYAVGFALIVLAVAVIFYQ